MSCWSALKSALRRPGTNAITFPTYINTTLSSRPSSLVTLIAHRALTTIPLDLEQSYISHNPIDLSVASANPSLANLASFPSNRLEPPFLPTFERLFSSDKRTSVHPWPQLPPALVLLSSSDIQQQNWPVGYASQPKSHALPTFLRDDLY